MVWLTTELVKPFFLFSNFLFYFADINLSTVDDLDAVKKVRQVIELNVQFNAV